MSIARRFRPSSPTPMLVRSLPVGLRTYEQRYTRCHKPSCSVCQSQSGPIKGTIGHGPYWYLCFRHGKGWTRIYLGKNLDTAKFVLPDGSIDFALILARRADRAARRLAATNV